MRKIGLTSTSRPKLVSRDSKATVSADLGRGFTSPRRVARSTRSVEDCPYHTLATAMSQESARMTRDDDELIYKVILVPIDFSEHSKRTVEYAKRIAARDDASIRLLHVFQIPEYAVTQYEHRQQGSEQLRSQVDWAEEEAQENSNAFENELLSKGIKVKAYLRVGYPFEEIVLMANDPQVDLVIIGSHGRSGIKR